MTITKIKSDLPMRIGVGVILLNNKNEVFVGKRRDNPSIHWQMPQGGVDGKETLIDAAKRELFEETGIKKVKIIKEIDKWLEYELPENLIGIIWKGKFRGQRQKWFIARFLGQDNEVNLDKHNMEFIDWKWINFEELPKVIVKFKKNLYETLTLEIRNIVN